MHSRIKKFVKDNKKNLLEIAGFAVMDLCVVAIYTHGCKAYGYRMVKPSREVEGAFYLRDLLGKEYAIMRVQK
jgi:hypothetical protein